MLTLHSFRENSLILLWQYLQQNIIGIDMRRHIVLLPTLRSRQFFIQSMPENGFLPHILTFGCTDSETLPMNNCISQNVLTDAGLLCHLIKLIRGKIRTDNSVSLAKLAMQFLYEVETFGITSDCLDNISFGHLAKHWQKNRYLMEIILRDWPEYAQHNNIITKTMANILWLDNLSAFIGQNKHNLHVAGIINDTDPYLSFLKKIGDLHLILPFGGGNAICDNTVSKMLAGLGLSDSVSYPQSDVAAVFGFNMPQNYNTPSNIILHNDEHPATELRHTAISIKKIRTLQPDRIISIISDDTNFLQQLKSALLRYGIIADDPVGEFFHHSQFGRAVLLLLNILSQPIDIATISAFLLHPLTTLHDNSIELRNLGRDLLQNMRDVTFIKPQKWTDILHYKTSDILPVLHTMALAFSRAKNSADAIQTLRDGVANLISGSCQYWDGLYSQLNNADNTAIPLVDLPSVIFSLSAKIIIPTKWQADRNVRIMGLYDAYAIKHDIIFMPAFGCDDVAIAAEAIAPPQILNSMGIKSNQNDTRAHILSFLWHQDDVRISHNNSSNNNFIKRITLFYPEILQQRTEIIDPDPLTPTIKPQLIAPTPPVNARPTHLSVSDIAILQRNPFAIYASKILKLSPKRTFDDTSNRALYGNLIHRLCEIYYKNTSINNDNDFDVINAHKLCEQIFMPIKSHHFLWTFWTTKAMNILAQLHIFNLYSKWQIAALEQRGEISIKINNTDYKITARADRIDTNHNSDIRIIDYKTGTPPSISQIKNGIAPQLLLEAVMVKMNAFPNINGEVTEISYMHLRGIDDGNSIKNITFDKDISNIINKTEEWLNTMLNTFNNPQQPYFYLPNPDLSVAFNSYDHLARGGGGDDLDGIE